MPALMKKFGCERTYPKKLYDKVVTSTAPSRAPGLMLGGRRSSHLSAGMP